ncbi:MAG: HGGxSTG domain-containing protein [Rubrobacter sp.]
MDLVAGYDIWSGEIRLWWSRTKRERPRCGSRCRDGSPCEASPVWDRLVDRPVNGRCRMHGGLSTGPKTEEGRRRIAESNRARSSRPDVPGYSKRGNGETVTQQGDTS